MKALSIRAPWWFFIINGPKDIENRDWRTDFRGTVLVHASKTIVKRDIEDHFRTAAAIMAAQTETAYAAHAVIPAFSEERNRGAIVGKVDIVDCVRQSASPWFFGRYGFVLANPVAFAYPIPFKGALGFFEVPDDLVRTAVPVSR